MVQRSNIEFELGVVNIGEISKNSSVILKGHGAKITIGKILDCVFVENLVDTLHVENIRSGAKVLQVS
ncbi:MAG: hypothetical protein P857_152 [Candidatus Xenolissoclinum pacificiensis L6]|uniref:Uncharacterized protein n=1 Tax=Candidatus Xenolissoclinum pacificiensis L6 TaxID=1401685 RepID=W2V099_9RICK|nr:MAG: hypothetical protein P857_152 [Candidatus Xenolissoclinum pacificiensis L6]